ncbi:hypothetical protein A6302_03302 [Methylobrevis pamukkalensis]|uniref:Uncharacterized protein n=1 Tax=Methylobrevis pamukkalensis TaxID=1439726 RepID=A0A1E3GZD9_9HYPH|nr:hypothetical protein A6302_03302 [Methylobrevis pamukkalensis]
MKDVIARTAIELVLAAAAGEHVVTAAAVDGVRKGTARDRVDPRPAPEHQLLEILGHRAVGQGKDRLRIGQRQGEAKRRPLAPDAELVDVDAAVEFVAGRFAGQEVVAGAAGHGARTRSAIDPVVPVLAEQDVVTFVAIERVIPASGIDHIAKHSARDGIVAASGLDEQLLDVDQRRAVGQHLLDGRIGDGEGERQVQRIPVEMERVAPLAAIDDVAFGGLRDDGVRAAAAEHHVCAAAAEQHVVAALAAEEIVAVAAVEMIVAEAPNMVSS